MKTERLTILLTPAQKRAIAERARKLDLSAGEVIRRAVESYRPQAGEDEAVLGALADELTKSAREARKALDSAVKEVDATVAALAARRLSGRKAA